MLDVHLLLEKSWSGEGTLCSVMLLEVLLAR